MSIPSKPASAAPGDPVGEAMAREEAAGLVYVFWGRLAVLGLLAVWIASTLPMERAVWYLAAIALFAAMGTIPYVLRRKRGGDTVIMAAFLLMDAAALSYVLLVPVPFEIEGWTPQMNLRTSAFLYLGVFVVSMALSYKPALVVWTGLVAIVAWSLGYLWVATLPGAVPFSARDVLDRVLAPEMAIGTILHPNAVALNRLSNQVVFLGLVTLILVLAVWRSRRLVRRQVAAEAQRAELSRYFSPTIVRELSAGRWKPDEPGVRPVAVLFADMVGFTAISERLPPDALIALLRGFHGRLARVAFDHDGTVDKYIGDAIMVHFGTPLPRPDDAVRALSCAAGMADVIDQWTGERIAAGEPPIAVAIGAHYGQVVVGNIGDQRKLEYTVLGDTVNVAGRLEKLTREVGATLVVSDDLVTAARNGGADPATVLANLRDGGTHQIRGRQEPVTVWCAGWRG